MIDVNKLGFTEEVMKVITDFSEHFREVSIEEGEEVKLSDWINANINNVEGDFFKGWTDREKYLYVLGVITGALGER